MTLKSNLYAAELPNIKGRLPFVDGLRGAAALWVVLFHFAMTGQFREAAHFLPDWVVDGLFFQGHLGVWVFFVVSGFVVALAFDSRCVDDAFARRFIVRRVMRLVPPYYVSIAATLAFFAARSWLRHEPVQWPGLSAVAAQMSFLTDLLGLQDISIVYWTLAIEMQFYITFVALMWCCDCLSRRAGGTSNSARQWRNSVVAAMAIASLAAAFGPWGRPPSATFLGFWYAFIAGVLSFAGTRPERAGRLLLVFYLGMLGLAAVASRSLAPLTVACTAGAIGLAGILGRLPTALNWKPLQFVGLVSYGLYLLHGLMIVVVGSLTGRLMSAGAARDLVGLGSTLTLSLIAAAAMWRYVERPGQTRFYELLQRSRAKIAFT